jgi:hypothetical protein
MVRCTCRFTQGAHAKYIGGVYERHMSADSEMHRPLPREIAFRHLRFTEDHLYAALRRPAPPRQSRS